MKHQRNTKSDDAAAFNVYIYIYRYRCVKYSVSMYIYVYLYVYLLLKSFVTLTNSKGCCGHHMSNIFCSQRVVISQHREGIGRPMKKRTPQKASTYHLLCPSSNHAPTSRFRFLFLLDGSGTCGSSSCWD